MVFGFKLINNLSSQPESIMSEDDSKVAKKLEELSQQVKSLRRIVIGLAVFFVTLVCFLVGPTPGGEAILFAVIANDVLLFGVQESHDHRTVDS